MDKHLFFYKMGSCNKIKCNTEYSDFNKTKGLSSLLIHVCLLGFQDYIRGACDTDWSSLKAELSIFSEATTVNSIIINYRTLSSFLKEQTLRLGENTKQMGRRNLNVYIRWIRWWFAWIL